MIGLFCCWLFLGADPRVLTWAESPRDIYVDGALSRGDRWLRGEAGELYLPDQGKWAYLIKENGIARLNKRELEEGNSPLQVQANAVELRDTRGTARWLPNGTVVLEIGRHSVLITRHEGPAGPLEEADLYTAAPVWEDLKQAYEPDQAAVAKIKSVAQPRRIDLYFGTWCGDSRRIVPHVLKSLAAANNKAIELHLIGIDRDFLNPGEDIRHQRITNVPTIIVSRDGQEINRLVERKVGDLIESDLAVMLTGSFVDDFARHPAEDVIAEGRLFHYLEDDNSVEETWWLLRGKDERRVLKSRLVFADEIVEARLSSDTDHSMRFLEITRYRDESLQRTRAFYRDGQWSITMRGSDTGIIRQEMVGDWRNAPWRTPSAAIDAWLLANHNPDEPVVDFRDRRLSVDTLPAPLLTTETDAGNEFFWAGQHWLIDENGLLSEIYETRQLVMRDQTIKGAAWEDHQAQLAARRTP